MFQGIVNFDDPEKPHPRWRKLVKLVVYAFGVPPTKVWRPSI